MFQCISTAVFRLSMAKCQFGANEVKFIGRTITPLGVAPQDHKIQNYLKTLKFTRTKNGLQRYILGSYSITETTYPDFPKKSPRSTRSSNWTIRPRSGSKSTVKKRQEKCHCIRHRAPKDGRQSTQQLKLLVSNTRKPRRSKNTHQSKAGYFEKSKNSKRYKSKAPQAVPKNGKPSSKISNRLTPN